MKLTNYKEYEKQVKKLKYDADGLLNELERWASECDGSYGLRNINYHENIYYNDISFELVKPAKYELKDENTNEVIGIYQLINTIKLPQGVYVERIVEEPVYRFIK